MTDPTAARVIRTPDQRLRAFVSSTLEELAEERASVREAVQRLHLAPVLFELGARPHPPRDLYRAYLSQSHVFIGIYWQRYGWVAPGEEVSGLEDEYRLSGDMPKLIYVKTPAPDREPRLRELLDRIRSDDAASYKRFSSATELGELVEDDLMVLLSERFEVPTERASPAGRPEPRPSKVPTALNRFVGRSQELAEVRELASRSRLLTLVGPGGTGKTRLALQAAHELRKDYADRVYFVDLASSRDSDAVVSAIARTVGVHEESGGPLLAEVKAQIDGERMLLLLDNFEQVTVAAPLVGELLRDCPGLSALVTSREPLRVTGEHVLPVPPLTLPRSDHRQVSVDELSRSEAVELFVDRARANRPDFRLSEKNADAVAELCRRLDGLPLAIELAAARLSLFSPQELVQRLGNRLRLLQGGARDAPPRHQTLGATIAWSYEMLDPGERRLFQLLSVFSGATVEAVEAVAGRLPGLDGIDVVETLGSLVDKSLVRQVRHDGSPSRTVMLETVREFSAARISEDPDLLAAAVVEHAAYYSEWTHCQWEQLTGGDREVAATRMAADLENIQAAWRYWVAHHDIEQLAKLTDSLWFLYDVRGWYHAMVALATDLLEVLDSTPGTHERALEQIVLQTSLARVLLAVRGYTQEVEAAYVRALELCEGQGGVPQLLPVLRGLASFHMLRAEFEQSAEAGEQILRLAERYDDATARVEGELVLGASLAFLNRLREGIDHLERGIEAYEPARQGFARFQLGNNPGVVCFTTSAMVLWMLGRPDRARERALAAIDLARGLHHAVSVAYAQFHAGLLHLWGGEHELAAGCADAVLAIADENDLPVWRAVGSCLRGATLAGSGAGEQGLAVMDQGMGIYQQLKSPPVFWPMLLYLRAGACGSAGRPQDGVPLLDEAMALARETSGRTLWSEFWRLKGELLLALPPVDAGEAEHCFQQAVVAADELDAPMLQLRATTALARLMLARGEGERAHQLLTAARSRLSAGPDNPDVREADALLRELES